VSTPPPHTLEIQASERPSYLNLKNYVYSVRANIAADSREKVYFLCYVIFLSDGNFSIQDRRMKSFLDALRSLLLSPIGNNTNFYIPRKNYALRNRKVYKQTVPYVEGYISKRSQNLLISILGNMYYVGVQRFRWATATIFS
jgi:hypothetical protein